MERLCGLRLEFSMLWGTFAEGRKHNPEENRMRHTSDDEDEDWAEDDDADEGYIPCPHCGETMLEAADYCPGCHRWITSEDPPSRRQPWWIVVIVLILLATLIFSVLPL